MLDMEARRGRFTASNIADIIFVKEPTETFWTLVYEKAYERLGIDKPEEKWVGEAIEWGNTYESLAIMGLEIRLGVQVTNNKIESQFFSYQHNAGCTPDGLIGEDQGAEIKCPFNPAIFLKKATITDQLELKKKFKNDYWQCMASILFTGRKSWIYGTYHPEFDTKHDFMGILKIEADRDEFKLLMERLVAAETEVQKIVNQILKK